MADYTKLKVAELRALLKERDIPTTGLSKKQQMTDALEANDNGAHDAPHDTDADADADADTVAANGTSKKRKRAASPADEPPKKTKAEPKVAEAQIATSSTLRIPVDEGCPLASYRVYVDPSDGIIYDASLNQTNAGKNNNKFYRVQVRNHCQHRNASLH